MNKKIQLINDKIKGTDNDIRRKLIILLAVAGIILIVIPSLSSDENEDKENNADKQPDHFSESDYTDALEEKLEDMVSSMYGAGNAKVTVTLDCDYETVYARDTGYSKDDSSSDEDSEYIIIGSSDEEEGLVLKTVTPKVRGVAVLCGGGDDPDIRTEITQMLCALLDIGSDDVSISKIQYSTQLGENAK